MARNGERKRMFRKRMLAAAIVLMAASFLTLNFQQVKGAEEETDATDADASYEIIEEEGENLPEETPDYGTGTGTLVVQTDEGASCSINGEAAAEQADYEAGTTISISVSAADGYELGNIAIADAQGNTLLMEQNAVSSYETEYTVYGGFTQTLTVEAAAKETDAYEAEDMTVIDPDANVPTYMYFKAKTDASLSVINNGRIYVNQDGELAYCQNVNKHGAKQGITGKLSKNHALQHAYDYLMYYGYPAHTTIEGKAFSKRQAHDVTQWAAWTIQYLHAGKGYLNLSAQNATIQKTVRALADHALAYGGGNEKIDGSAYIYVPASSKKQPFILPRYEKPLGEAALKKVSASESITKDNAMYSLEGAQYGVYKDAACTQLAGTLTTDQNGGSNTLTLEPATYYAKEIKASAGFELDSTLYTVKVKSNYKTTFQVREKPQMDPLGLTLVKRDLEIGKDGLTLGTASLAGAEFTVNYYDTYESISGRTPKRTWTLVTRKTDGKFVAGYQKDDLLSGDTLYQYEGAYVLPLGTYEIWESKAPEGYNLNQDAVLQNEQGETVATGAEHYVTQVKAAGKTVALSGGNTCTRMDRVIRGDFKLQKTTGGGNRLAGVRFSITSEATGESHEFVTDENGMFDSSSAFNRHSVDTNGKEAGSGLWFGQYQDTDGSLKQVPANDDYGALIYDQTYILNELSCEANEGLALITGVHFTLSRDGYEVDLGTFDDAELGIGTTAVDKESQTHTAEADGTVVIADTVEYYGLTKGETYTLIAQPARKSTGMVIQDGNGTPISGKLTFTAKRSSGKEVVEVSVPDAVAYAGDDIVILESLYEGTETEGSSVSIAEHRDLESAEQTVHLKEKETPETPAEEEEVSAKKTPDKKSVGKRVQTGVVSHAGELALAAALCMSGALIVAKRKRKRKRNL